MPTIVNPGVSPEKRELPAHAVYRSNATYEEGLPEHYPGPNVYHQGHRGHLKDVSATQGNRAPTVGSNMRYDPKSGQTTVTVSKQSHTSSVRE